MSDVVDLATSRLIAQLALEDLTEWTHHDEVTHDPFGVAAVASEREYWESFLRTIDDHRRVQATPTVVQTALGDRPSVEGVVTGQNTRAAPAVARRGLLRTSQVDDHRRQVQPQVTRRVVQPQPRTGNATGDVGVAVTRQNVVLRRASACSLPVVSRELVTASPSNGRRNATGPTAPPLRRQTGPGEVVVTRQNVVLRRASTFSLPTASRKLVTAGPSNGPRNANGVVIPDQERNRPRTVKRPKCVACTEVIRGPHYYHNTCNHSYCSECISTLVDACVRDETLYPPRCCNQSFNLEELYPFLNPDLYTIFNVKRREYEVPTENRIYCPTPACSRFLGSSATAGRLAIRCASCRTLVCPRCRQRAHPGFTCPEDQATLAVRELGRTQGWQTCHRCQAVVELNQGCYHVTCRCRAEFCYLCGMPWKHCACPQWDEQRIVYAAQQRVEAEVGPRLRMNDAVRRYRVGQMVRVLRENHDCAGHEWGRRNVPARCEMCHVFMPWYVYSCERCRAMMCGRCRFNRV